MTALPGMRQGGLGARDELRAAQALVRAHLRLLANLASYPPGPLRRRRRARLCRSFAGQFAAASDVHAKVRKSSLRQL